MTKIKLTPLRLFIGIPVVVLVAIQGQNEGGLFGALVALAFLAVFIVWIVAAWRLAATAWRRWFGVDRGPSHTRS